MISEDTAKTLGGLICIVTLNGMIVTDTVVQEIAFSDQHLYILLLMIGAFLGLDMLGKTDSRRGSGDE